VSSDGYVEEDEAREVILEFYNHFATKLGNSDFKTNEEMIAELQTVLGKLNEQFDKLSDVHWKKLPNISMKKLKEVYDSCHDLKSYHPATQDLEESLDKSIQELCEELNTVRIKLDNLLVVT